MATKIATAQRKAAAMERIAVAAQAAGIEPPSISPKSDPDVQIAAVLEWTAAALEQIADGARNGIADGTRNGIADAAQDATAAPAATKRKASKPEAAA